MLLRYILINIELNFCPELIKLDFVLVQLNVILLPLKPILACNPYVR